MPVDHRLVDSGAPEGRLENPQPRATDVLLKITAGADAAGMTDLVAFIQRNRDALLELVHGTIQAQLEARRKAAGLSVVGGGEAAAGLAALTDSDLVSRYDLAKKEAWSVDWSKLMSVLNAEILRRTGESNVATALERLRGRAMPSDEPSRAVVLAAIDPPPDPRRAAARREYETYEDVTLVSYAKGGPKAGSPKSDLEQVATDIWVERRDGYLDLLRQLHIRDFADVLSFRLQGKLDPAADIIRSGTKQVIPATPILADAIDLLAEELGGEDAIDAQAKAAHIAELPESPREALEREVKALRDKGLALVDQIRELARTGQVPMMTLVKANGIAEKLPDDTSIENRYRTNTDLRRWLTEITADVQTLTEMFPPAAPGVMPEIGPTFPGPISGLPIPLVDRNELLRQLRSPLPIFDPQNMADEVDEVQDLGLVAHQSDERGDPEVIAATHERADAMLRRMWDYFDKTPPAQWPEFDWKPNIYDAVMNAQGDLDDARGLSGPSVVSDAVKTAQEVLAKDGWRLGQVYHRRAGMDATDYYNPDLWFRFDEITPAGGITITRMGPDGEQETSAIYPDQLASWRTMGWSLVEVPDFPSISMDSLQNVIGDYDRRRKSFAVKKLLEAIVPGVKWRIRWGRGTGSAWIHADSDVPPEGQAQAARALEAAGFGRGDRYHPQALQQTWQHKMVPSTSWPLLKAAAAGDKTAMASALDALIDAGIAPQRARKKGRPVASARRERAAAAAPAPDGYTIVKHDGSLPWHIERPDGSMLRRFPTKQLATGFLAIVRGDVSDAPRFYRLVLAQARRQMDERDALRSARMTAQELGLEPDTVQADPDTGEPLPPAGGSEVVVHHSPEQGTLAYGETKPVREVLKTHGFRWSKNIVWPTGSGKGAWFIRATRGDTSPGVSLDEVGRELERLIALNQLGLAVSIERPE